MAHGSLERGADATGPAGACAGGLAQLYAYLDRLALDHGFLVLFDRRTASSPLADRISTEPTRTPEGCPVLLVRS